MGIVLEEFGNIDYVCMIYINHLFLEINPQKFMKMYWLFYINYKKVANHGEGEVASTLWEDLNCSFT